MRLFTIASVERFDKYVLFFVIPATALSIDKVGDLISVYLVHMLAGDAKTTCHKLIA